MVTMSGEVFSRMRTPLEPILYRLAWEHISHIDEPQTDPLEHPIQAIILSVACLETFINAIGMVTLGVGWDNYEAGHGPGQDHRPRLADKWIEITKHQNDGKTFGRGDRLFQEFTGLIRLRNYILHYKSPFTSPVPTSKGNVTEARALINDDSARKAVVVMKEMLQEFHRLSGGQAPDWVV